MQTAKGAAVELQAPSTSFTSDATQIPRQLDSVNLDFSGASLLMIILQGCCILWHGVMLLVTQPGVVKLVSCCVQLLGSRRHVSSSSARALLFSSTLQ